jgi:protocatechuate 3,4-dioxygenase beta subunit
MEIPRLRSSTLLLPLCAAAAAGVLLWSFAQRPERAAASAAPRAGRPAAVRPEEPPTERSEVRADIPHEAAEEELPPVEGMQVAGLIVDPEGQPLVQLAVGVRADERDPPVRARSLADGRFALQIEAAPCEFEVLEPGWTTVRFGEVQDPPGPGEPRVVAARSQALEGVVLEPSGSPLAGAALALRLEPGCAEFSARSGSDGRFRFDEAPALPKLRLRTALEGWETDERELALPAAEPLRIVLRPGQALGPLLEGTVVHPDGAPAPGALVALGSARARADAAGRFRLHCGWCAPETPLVALARGFQPAIVAGYGARIDPLAPSLPPERLQLPGPELVLAGKLVDADGAPLKGWRVGLADPTPLDPGGNPRESAEGESGVRVEVRSDVRGGFSFSGLSARSYTLLASGRDRTTRLQVVVCSDPVPAGTRDVLLRAGRNAGVRALVGRVVDETGAPVADASVGLGRVALPSGASEHALQGRLRTRSDAAGRFEISGAPPGTLYLVATRPGLLPRRLEIDPAARTDALLLRLDTPRPFRFEFAGGADGPDRLRAVAAVGPAELWSLVGALPARIGCVRLGGERSRRLGVGPEAREIVIYRGLLELARFPAPPRAANGETETALRWP